MFNIQNKQSGIILKDLSFNDVVEYLINMGVRIIENNDIENSDNNKHIRIYKNEWNEQYVVEHIGNNNQYQERDANMLFKKIKKSVIG